MAIAVRRASSPDARRTERYAVYSSCVATIEQPVIARSAAMTMERRIRCLLERESER